ncbi:MAG: hypothetical protein QOC56_280 [Alphaproteobacteria bacterium]|nr:hypothetical protein [Alphaproteobacteria bacterium]
MRRLGAEPKLASPQEFAAFLAAEAPQWAAVAKAAAVKLRRSDRLKPDPRDPEGRARRRQGSAGRHSGGGGG